MELFAHALLMAVLVSVDPTASPVPPLPAPAKPVTTPSPSPTPSPGPPFGNMSWREIGPAGSGGRVAAVAGSATNTKLYYVGAAGGGVWKSSNSGQTWDAVFEKEGTAAIGAVTIDPTDDKTVWVGTGEANPRNDVSYGDGVYKTTDGGDTWTNVGLKASKYISRILVDPRNHNHVIVGALGDAFADSSDRGVYVTDDGGRTWKQTLYVGPESGASDLAMSAQNPSVVYAGIWKFQRRPWTFLSGGAEDGLYKSTDGGETWTKLEGHGLPAPPMGRIGLAVAPSDGNRVYALIESKEGILWRSDDGGANWKMVSKDSLIDARPFYFSHIAVDPKNPNRVFAISFEVMLSTNAGETFKATADASALRLPRHLDRAERSVTHHSGRGRRLRAHARRRRELVLLGEPPDRSSLSRGARNDNPYTVCAGLQDNNGWCGPSNSLDPSGIQNKHWIARSAATAPGGSPSPTIRTGFGPTRKTARCRFTTESRKTAGRDSRT